MRSSKFNIKDSASCSLKSSRKQDEQITFKGFVKVVCTSPDGTVKWCEEGENLVVDEGINYILGTAVLDSASLYIGLTTSTPSPAANWTMVNAQSVEAAGYDETNRVSWGQDAVVTKSVTNSTPATFTMDGTDTTIGGAFVTTNNTKDGTSGVLIALKAFTNGNKIVADNDKLDVTYTITAS